MSNFELAGPQSRPRGSVSAPDPHPAGPTRVRILTARVRTPRLHFIRLRGGGGGGREEGREEGREGSVVEGLVFQMGLFFQLSCPSLDENKGRFRGPKWDP
jgi:hypothetical protein